MKNIIQCTGLALGLSMAATFSITLGCARRHPHEQHTHAFLDDKVTAERVKAALSSSASYHFPNVQVTATNGTATLSGFVSNEEQKAQAVALAQSIHRVKKVETQLQVERPAPVEGRQPP
jgi:osmotically-inducible protein OsmY